MPCSPQQHSGVEAMQRVKSRALPLYPPTHSLCRGRCPDLDVDGGLWSLKHIRGTSCAPTLH